jgi:hypothetical protein
LTGEVSSDGTVLVATKPTVPFGFTGKRLKEI